MTSARTCDHQPGNPGDVSGSARKVSFSFSRLLMTMESVACSLDLRGSRRREGDLDEEDEEGSHDEEEVRHDGMADMMSKILNQNVDAVRKRLLVLNPNVVNEHKLSFKIDNSKFFYFCFKRTLWLGRHSHFRKLAAILAPS